MRPPIVILFISLAAAGCASKARVVAPAIDLSPRLAEADGLVQAGCFDCLRDALQKYQAVRTVAGATATDTDSASAGAFRAAALLALRQRELGMVDDGYLKTARETRAGGSLEWLLDIIEILPVGSTGEVARPATSDAELENRQRLFRNREVWSSALRDGAGQDILTAYVWVAFACGPSGGTRRDETLAAIGPLRDVPLLQFRQLACFYQPDRIQAFQAADPRFVEVSYLLALMAVGQRKLDDAVKPQEQAYAWHPQWPALTLSMANVALTAEEFERALNFYDRTLTLEPRAADSLLGRVRALTYLTRYDQAIAATDHLLSERWHLGEARYWRALNEVSLGRLEEAWTDVEEAAKLLVNADVPKLAGIIAYRRKQLEVARAKFDESRQRNELDCETGFYLGVVLAEQRNWPRTADVFIATAKCLETFSRQMVEEIGQIRDSDAPPERKARQIAKRERQIAEAGRMVATSSFNTAAAYYNLSRGAEARPFAEKVAADEQFGERARDLLSRLK